METTKHTTIPWHYVKGAPPHNQGQVYYEDTGQRVAITYDDEDGANACLIAASPDMLEALQATLTTLRGCFQTVNVMNRIESINDVIQKATTPRKDESAYTAYITVKFKTPVSRELLDIGALRIQHSSGRSYLLDGSRSWLDEDNQGVEIEAIADFETFPKGEEYPYDLTWADAESGELKATFFVGDDSDVEVDSITYILTNYSDREIARGLLFHAEKEVA